MMKAEPGRLQVLREWLSLVPWWLWLAGGAVLGAVPALLLGVSREALPAALALLGVILGGAIAAAANVLVSQAGRRAQIVAATWPRRVEAHQAAFTLWWRLTGLIFKEDELGQVILEAENWWASDCLYLSEGARTAFKRMVQLASSHRELVHSYRGTSNQAGTRAVNDSWAQIMAVGQLLAEGAGCHLSDQVLDDLRGKALPEKKSGKD
jgi:hypothetical protein